MTPPGPDQAFLAQLTVLYVEDDPEVRHETAAFLRRRVGRLCLAANGQEGLDACRLERPDLLVTDLMMPVMDGLTMVETLRAERPDLPVVVVTAFERVEYLMRALTLGVDRYVLKPLDPDLLEAALLHCAHGLRSERELAAFRKQKADRVQAQHAEAIGLLASGMAHDYSNVLQNIMSLVSLARLSAHAPDQVRQHLDATQAAWGTVKDLGNRLRQLTEQQDALRCTERLEPVLRTAVAQALEPTRLVATFALPASLPPVRFNRDQMAQVFAILAVNAAEATGGEGSFHVAAAQVQVAPDDPLPLAEGTYLQVRFRDRGPGIADAMLPIMFSPYASSKERCSERGTGLSLARAQCILKLHAGGLFAENAPGGGAVLNLYLPVP